jgi:hypothetical protein
MYVSRGFEPNIARKHVADIMFIFYISSIRLYSTELWSQTIPLYWTLMRDECRELQMGRGTPKFSNNSTFFPTNCTWITLEIEPGHSNVCENWEPTPPK